MAAVGGGDDLVERVLVRLGEAAEVDEAAHGVEVGHVLDQRRVFIGGGHEHVAQAGLDEVELQRRGGLRVGDVQRGDDGAGGSGHVLVEAFRDDVAGGVEHAQVGVHINKGGGGADIRARDLEHARVGVPGHGGGKHEGGLRLIHLRVGHDLLGGNGRGRGLGFFGHGQRREEDAQNERQEGGQLFHGNLSFSWIVSGDAPIVKAARVLRVW